MDRISLMEFLNFAWFCQLGKSLRRAIFKWELVRCQWEICRIKIRAQAMTHTFSYPLVCYYKSCLQYIYVKGIGTLDEARRRQIPAFSVQEIFLWVMILMERERPVLDPELTLELER